MNPKFSGLQRVCSTEGIEHLVHDRTGGSEPCLSFTLVYCQGRARRIVGTQYILVDELNEYCVLGQEDLGFTRVIKITVPHYLPKVLFSGLCKGSLFLQVWVNMIMVTKVV